MVSLTRLPARFLAVFAVLLTVAQPLFAVPVGQQKFENLDRLDSIVSITVGANIGEPGGPVAPIDRRLRLAACPQVPAVEGPVFGAAIVKCDPLGWRIRVPLSAGGAAAMAAPMPAMARPYGTRAPAQPREILIRKGDPVQLVAGNSAFSVTRSMVADEDGAIGDMIRVRQDRTSPIVIARIEAQGIVRVPTI